MIRSTIDRPTDKQNIRTVTFEYNSISDAELLNKVEKFISDNQPTCFNCENHYQEGSFGGYMASCCKLHGCLETWGNLHYDCDGSKCGDYKRK